MRLSPLEQELVDALDAVRGGKSCWCPLASYPGYQKGSHSEACAQAQNVLRHIKGVPEVRQAARELRRRRRQG